MWYRIDKETGTEEPMAARDVVQKLRGTYRDAVEVMRDAELTVAIKGYAVPVGTPFAIYECRPDTLDLEVTDGRPEAVVREGTT